MTSYEKALAKPAGDESARARPQTSAWTPGPSHWPAIVSFSIIGAICTVAFALLYNLLRAFASPIGTNLLALGLTMVINFTANRWFTFHARSGSMPRQAMRYALVYLVGLGASTLVLDLGLNLVARPGRATETLIALASGVVATVIRFLLLSGWVFRPAPHSTISIATLSTSNPEPSSDR